MAKKKKKENRVDGDIQSVIETIKTATGHLQEAAESLPEVDAYEATRKRLVGLSDRAQGFSVLLEKKAEKESLKAERAENRKAKLQEKIEKLQAELEKS